MNKHLTLLGVLALSLQGCSFLPTLESPSEPLVIEIDRDRTFYEEIIIKHEGFRNLAYPDRGSLAIGYGRNLTFNGISKEEARYLLRNDIDRLNKGLAERFPASQKLDSVRYAVVLSMAYNLGLDGLAGFKKMWTAIENADYVRASVEMYLSNWCGQVGDRCGDLAYMMENGEIRGYD